MPPSGHNGSTDLPDPNQNLGSRGVRHLASKLLLTSFPPSAPFFRYEIDDLVLDNIASETGQDDIRGEVEKALNSRERAVMAEMNSASFRPFAFETFRQLILSGNFLLFVPNKGKVRGFRLDSYVVARDPSGNVLEIIVEEAVAKSVLSEEQVNALHQQPVNVENQSQTASQEDHKLHTRILRRGQWFYVYQEIDGNIIDESSGKYPLDLNPWLPLRLTSLTDEDYGRGYVEEYMGDLITLDNISAIIREGTAQMAKIIWQVNPGSHASASRYAKAKNGDFVQGEEGSVRALQAEKSADFIPAQQLAATITDRLSFAFLLNSAVQRSGERVTAEEIRFMAQELENSLGGMYSLLAEEFQLPVVRLFEKRMERTRKVPPLPEGTVSPTIVTGLDALGRGNDLNNLDALIGGAAQTLGPEVIQTYLNTGEYFKRRGASLGVDMDGLIRTDEDIEKARQQQQLQALVEQLGPNAINQLGGLAQQGVANGGELSPPDEDLEETN